MGGATGSESHTTMQLEQPWGTVTEKVRVFPPCRVPNAFNSVFRGGGAPVVIFAKSKQAKVWRRKTIDNGDFFPDDGFIAWDDKNSEYAWHEIGSIDVPHAADPVIKRFTPIIRGESEPIVYGAGIPKRPRARGERKGRFMRWWTGHSRANEVPDFLRSEDTLEVSKTVSVSGRSIGVTGS